MTHYGQDYFEPVPTGPGLNRLSANTCRVLDFELLVLAEGGTHEFASAGREFGVVVLTGVVDIRVGDRLFETVGGRRSVFEGQPSMVYAPQGSPVVITARGAAEVALCACPSQSDIAPYRLDPTDAITGRWGQFNTTRTFNYMINASRPSERLHLAEVTVESGNWATYPPHKHDVNRPEVGEVFQEEMYFYRTDHPDGFGFCASYGGLTGTDFAFMVRNNTIHKMPAGYHTVCAAPGYKVWYLALIAGDDKRHAVFTDPDHAWYGRAETALANVRENLIGHGRSA